MAPQPIGAFAGQTAGDAAVRPLAHTAPMNVPPAATWWIKNENKNVKAKMVLDMGAYI